jgi:RHS repeat-associated protein
VKSSIQDNTCSQHDARWIKSVLVGMITIHMGAYFEWTGSTSTMKKYYSAGGARVAVRTGASTRSFILSDHPSPRSGQALGSTSVTTDSSGALLTDNRYKVWGELRYASGTLPTKFTYTGQYSNVADFGLMYYGSRWYDSSLGRFLSADTLIPQPGNAQAWDRYAYVMNNALKYIDPSGHTSACAGPNADPECATAKKPAITKLTGWNPWYGQIQPDDTACFPTATAAGLSTLMGGQVSAAQLDKAMENIGAKGLLVGVPPDSQDDAINTLADAGMGNFSGTYAQGTRVDLIKILEKGLPTIVSVSWGYHMPIGHALLVTAYNRNTDQFSFFDPARGDVITEQQFFARYKVTFMKAWINQPTIFVPAGPMVTLISR